MRPLINERAEYIKVTNGGVICPDCGLSKGYLEYIKIFKIKNYPPPPGFRIKPVLEEMLREDTIGMSKS